MHSSPDGESQRPLALVDFVLLACQFSILGEAADRVAEAVSAAEIAAQDEPVDISSEKEARQRERGINVDGVLLNVLSITEDDDEFTFILRTRLTEASVPYELEVITGSSFQIPEPRITKSEAASTLLFMTYPYVRELVASITGRSPYESFTMPPLTKLPHPDVLHIPDQE